VLKGTFFCFPYFRFTYQCRLAYSESGRGSYQNGEDHSIQEGS